MLVPCPRCKSPLIYSQQSAGTKVQCADCKAGVNLPLPDDLPGELREEWYRKLRLSLTIAEKPHPITGATIAIRVAIILGIVVVFVAPDEPVTGLTIAAAIGLIGLQWAIALLSFHVHESSIIRAILAEMYLDRIRPQEPPRKLR